MAPAMSKPDSGKRSPPSDVPNDRKTVRLVSWLLALMASLGSKPEKPGLVSRRVRRMDESGEINVAVIVSVLVGLLLSIVAAIIGLRIVSDNSDDIITNVGDINTAVTNNDFNDTTIDGAKSSFTAIFAILGLAFLLTLVAGVLVVRNY